MSPTLVCSVCGWRYFIIYWLLFVVLKLVTVSGFLYPSFGLRHVSSLPKLCDNQAKLWLSAASTGRPVLLPLYFRTSQNDQMERLATTVVEEDDEDDSEDDDVVDVEDVYDSKVLQFISKSVIPLSISIGFAGNPSKRLTLRIASAAAGGVLGLAAKSAIRSYARKPEISFDDGRFSGVDGENGGAPPSVARTLKQLTSSAGTAVLLTTPIIEAAARSHRVPEAQLSLLFTSLFADIVLEATESPSMDLTELIDVIRFAETNALSTAEIGDGLALAATRLGQTLERDDRGFYEAEFPEEVLRQAAKVLFLADKMIGIESSTGSGSGYYGRRMLPALSYFTLEAYQQVVTEACTQLFRRCVEGVLVEPRKYQSGEVEDLKQFLTTPSPAVSALRPALMQHMVLDAIQFMLNRTLSVEASPMEAAVENYDAFLEAQPVLGWVRREWLDTLEARTLPLFETALRGLFKQVVDQPARAEELSGVLQGRVEALRVDPGKARVLVTTLMSERNAEYMNRIDRVYNASGGAVEQAYKTMVSYAHTHEALQTLTAPIMRGAALPMPGLPFPDVVRANIYQTQLSKTGGTEDGSLGVHADMFALNEEQRQVVRKHLAMPKLSSWVKQCIQESNFHPSAKAAYEKQLTASGITSAEWVATAIDFYYQAALKVSQGRAVPTQEEMDRLAALRGFLGCGAELVAKVHLELFGAKYVKALTESMTPTGVITDEYVEGLQRLRARLGLQEADAESLFSVAARARVGPILKDLVDIWKSDTDAYYRREKEKKAKEDPSSTSTSTSKSSRDKKDKSGDPIDSTDNVFGYMEEEQQHRGAQKEGGGFNVFMREALNLVDFLAENHKLLDRDTTATASEEELSNLKITAGGMVQPQDLAGMFKHYVVTRLTEQDAALAQRYRATEGVFGRVLGIPAQGQRQIKESLAYSVYKRMLMEVLRRGDTVDARATAQYVQLRAQLDLEMEAADRIMQEATRGAVVAHTAKTIRATVEGQPLTPEAAQLLRTQVESLGLSWRTDLGFSDPLITYLYALEVQLLVEGGTAEEELGELQTAYDIPEQRAAEIVEATCKRYISQLLNLALRAAKKYDERDAVRWLKHILKYAPFVSSAVDADGNLFSAADKARLGAFLQAELDSGEDAELRALSERVGDVREKLREMIRLTEDFVAPLQGIEGLLGNVKTLAQLEADLNVDQGRKAWAWG